MHEYKGLYLWMDALRFWTALLVLVSHARNLIIVDYQGQAGTIIKLFYLMTSMGHQGVIVFFVLSGYWISQSVHKRIDAPNFWKNYLIDRLARLWIVLIPALIGGAVLDSIGLFVLKAPIYTGAIRLAALVMPINLDIFTFAGNMIFLQGLVVKTYGTNGPLWSLAYEFWFYIWFPAIMLLSRGRITLWLASLAAVLILPSLAIGFISWLMGAILFSLGEKIRYRRASRYGWAIAALGVIVTVGAAMISRINTPLVIYDPLIAVGFSMVLFGMMMVRPTSRPLFGREVGFARLGEQSSFSLYAIHFPLIALMISLVISQRLPLGFHAIAILAGVVLIAIVIARGFAAVTEAKTRTLRTWLKGRLGSQA